MIRRLFLVFLLCAAVLAGVAPAWAVSYGVPEGTTGGAVHDHHRAASGAPDACAPDGGGHAGHADHAEHRDAEGAGCPGAASACGGAFAGWPAGTSALAGRLPVHLPEFGPERHMTARVQSPDLRPPRTSS